jgi:hypothetical protein
MSNIVVADATIIDPQRLRLYESLKSQTAVAREKYARIANQVNEVVKIYFDEFPELHARVKHLRREIRYATKGVLSDVISDDSYATTGGTEQLHSAQKHIIARAYKYVANIVHPDKPRGDLNLFLQVQRAYDLGDLTFLTELFIRLENEPDPRWRQYEGIEFWKRELERPKVSLKILQTSPEFSIVRLHASGNTLGAKRLAEVRLNELAYALWQELQSVLSPDSLNPKENMNEPTKDTGILAPEGFAAHFVAVEYTTGPDGLFAGDFKATRHSTGKYNPELKDANKVRDLLSYDLTTAIGIASRLSARTFKTDPTKRLKPNTTYEIVIRAGIKKATGELATTVKSVAIVNDVSRTELEQDDPQSRLIRGAGRFLTQAFANVKNPPALVQKSEVVDE